MALEKFEKYVCIGFDDSSNIAECTVFSKPWITKLDKLCKQFPDKFKMTGEQIFDDNIVEGKSYEFPKNLISIRQPTKRKKMTEEQKKEIGERLQKGKETKQKKEKKVKGEDSKTTKSTK